MKTRPKVVSWLWRILACALAVVLGEMAGLPLVMALGLEMPRAVAGVDPELQFLLLFPAAFTMALALALLAHGLAGRWWQRWAVVGVFFFTLYGVGTALEGAIFTSLGGGWAAALIHLPACVLGALAATRLFPGSADEGFGSRTRAFFANWTAGGLTGRLALGWVAFPFFYFLFGMLILPLVQTHYEELDFLVIPPLPTILTVLFSRSAMFLVVSLAVIIGWRESRGRLILALGAGHFVASGLAGLIQAPFFPAVMRWTHSLEILADSMGYAVVLVWLFLPRRGREEEEQPALRERLA
jgi:hypothetical protein